MTTYRNSFNGGEGGEPGALITDANSGGESGDAFGQVTQTGGTASAARYEEDAAYEGLVGARFVLTSQGNSLRGYEDDPDSRGGVEWMLKWAGVPAGNSTLARIDNNSNSALCYLAARTDGGGQVRIHNASNSGTATGMSASAINVPSPGTPRWLKAALYVTPHASAGAAELYLAEEDGTPIGATALSGRADLGSTEPARFRVGDAVSGLGWTDYDVDMMMWGCIPEGRHLWEQVILGGPMTAENGQSITVDATRSTDTIIDWSQVSGPAVDLDTTDMAAPTFRAPFIYPGAPIVLEATGAQGSTAQQVINVLPAQLITLLPSGLYAPVERRTVLP